MMSGIRGKKTRPEMLVRRALFGAGYRFRLHRKGLSGVPDIALPGREIAIFAHACFWHIHGGSKNAKLPSTVPEFWGDKLQGNVSRDQRAIAALVKDGWRVLTVWECATRDPLALEGLSTYLTHWIEGLELTGEISASLPA